VCAVAVAGMPWVYRAQSNGAESFLCAGNWFAVPVGAAAREVGQ
jgi:hypothetical protein